MKVYCFYLIIDDLESPLLNEFAEFENIFELENHNVFLYGYTTKKKYAEDFISLRNMKKFIPMKMNMDKVEFEEFKKDYGTYERSLDYQMIDTRDIDGTKSYCKLLLNGYENEFYYSSMDHIDDIFINTFMYNELIYDILPCIKHKWLKEIGVDEINQIMRINSKISIGENVSITLNGINCILSYFGELFI